MPRFTIDFAQPAPPFEHFWEHTGGSGHIPLALRADWQAQLRQCHEELGFRHARFHNLLSGSLGAAIVHQDEVLYSFFNIDRQGPIVLMIENTLTGLVWRLMRRCPYIVTGLRRAGFQGGWLGAA